MNALLLTSMLSVLTAAPLSPPPMVSAPAKTKDTTVRVSSRVRLVSSLGLAGGTALSIGNTVAFWSTRLSNGSDGFNILGAVFGTYASSVPVVGPIAAMLFDLAFGSYGEQPGAWELRMGLNGVAAGVQLVSLILLGVSSRFDGVVTEPMRGLTVTPVSRGEGVVVGWSGTF